MKINRIVLLLFAIVLLLSFSATIAQDEATPEVTETTAPTEEVTVVPTAVPTEPAPVEPAPVIVDQVNFRVGIFGILTIVGSLVLGGFGLGAVWGHIRGSKAAKDELERAYQSLSPDAQEQILQARDQAQTAWDKVDQFAREVLKLVSEVSDGLPNEVTPPTG
jgi:hypothetical protein